MKNKISFAYSAQRVDTPVKEAGSNRRITFDDLRSILTSRSFPASYELLPALARRIYSDGDQAAFYTLKAYKKDLPWFLASGFCPVHHNDETLTYNGVLQIDIDLKSPDGDTQALALLNKIKSLRPDGVLLATLSPSTFGVKILLVTDNPDKENHSAALRAGIDYLAELLQVDKRTFDTLGASQACYIPFERVPGQAYFNPDADAPPIVFKERSDNKERSAAVVYDVELVREAVNYLVDMRADIATGYSEYLRITAACKNAFGDEGLQLAHDLLNNSTAFLSSNFSRKLKRKFDSLNRFSGNVATGATLVHIARENGFKGNVGRNTTTIQADWITDEHGKERSEYLTEVFARTGKPLTDILGKFLVAPTGTGKTTLVAEIVRRYAERRVILVLPLLAIVKQFCKEHREAVMYTGGAENRQIKGDEGLLVTTIQSFKALATRVDMKQYDVIMDEAHGMTADTSKEYKLDDIRAFYTLAKSQARSLSFMTGTDLYNFHPDFKEVERLVIKARKNVVKNLFYGAADDVLASAVDLIERSAAKGNKPVLLLNDKKKRLKQAKTLLQKLGITYLNSKTKDDPIFQQIASTGVIPDHVQGIVATTVIREGNSFKGNEIFDFIIVGQHHSSTIEQITSRPRTAKEVNVYVLKSSKREGKTGTKFNPWSMARLFEERARRVCDEQNNAGTYTDEAAMFQEWNLRSALQKDAVFVDTDGKMKVCPFLLNNLVYQQETIAEYRDNGLQARNLEQYGFNVSRLEHNLHNEHDAEKKQEIKQALNDFKKQGKDQHESALNALRGAISPLAIVEAAEKKSACPDVYKWFKRLVSVYGVDQRAAIELLQDIDTGKKYKTLENQLCADRLRKNRGYLKSGRLFSIMLLKMDKSLRPGKTYTADELLAKVVELLALDKLIRLDDWRPGADDIEAQKKAKRRALAWLRIFYDVDESGRKGARACPRKREYILNKITKFHGHGMTSPATKIASFTEYERALVQSAAYPVSVSESCPF